MSETRDCNPPKGMQLMASVCVIGLSMYALAMHVRYALPLSWWRFAVAMVLGVVLLVDAARRR